MQIREDEKKINSVNEAQNEAIQTTEGPVLITAGPGTGKTYTLVQRAVYLIETKQVDPSNILITTFTEKATKEIITRITNELLERGIDININEMYIGTFHSICLRFIKEYLEHTRVRKNYRALDDFDQKYLVFQNIGKFRSIENYDSIFSTKSAWKQSRDICGHVNNLSEELVSVEDLKKDRNPQIEALGNILSLYNELLCENNLLDFSSIQTEAYELLSNNPAILKELQEKIKYIMVDEYQDTNFIQEQLIFLLGNHNKNICVVGDDDQGLYRFRGATIRNILEFPYKFPDGVCKVIKLTTNYRSNSKIVDFYNNWMEQTDGAKFKFSWDKYRYFKKITAHEDSAIISPAVIKLSSVDDIDEWQDNIYDFIQKLKQSGKLTDYNQIAFLFNSVKSEKVANLSRFLESKGINVYSPRSDMFFKRYEIQLILGCLLLTFPNYVQKLATNSFKYNWDDLFAYYEDCITIANRELAKEENKPLKSWLREKGKAHLSLKKNTDYAFSGLLYQMFEFDLFKKYLDIDLDVGVVDTRPTRNISILTQILTKYEYLHRVSVLSSKKIEDDTEKLFNMYLRFLLDGGIGEYEDEAEYAPSGCVSFLTIHQSKGMEFPVVVVGSLSNLPRKSYSNLIKDVEEKYFKRTSYEPYDDMKYFDFWRLYYTAFSRAQDLLVLSGNETKREPSGYFENVYTDLKNYNDESFDLSEFQFHEVKQVNLKETYSFTSHVAVYNNCSLQYKFFKELGFTPIRIGSTVFGQLVHQTIEDIHRAAIRKEEHLINPDNISKWFEINYSTLSKNEHIYLGQPQLDAALGQVLRYAGRQDKLWHTVQEAEIEVGLVKPDYILKGAIDLIKGEGDTVEIIDFKSEKKPDLIKDKDKIEHYKKQLQIYSHLVEEKTGLNVSKMHLYYTAEENGVPTITFPKDKDSIDNTIQGFDGIVNKIQKKEFCHKSTSQLICSNCDFRFYCKN